CAAIPTGLLESELFGHEKGAFTGAIAQKIGRFELANGGTLFLDEVGDIPLELQSKFLRVLQEQEFERLGGTRTIRVDIRLVAATNRDLPAMVAGKQFRSDLYYRLNVFPIVSPPLRERREDIAPLVRYFTQKFARRMNKHITTIPTETTAALVRYHWPGNIRELENFMERAVILSRGARLDVPLAELKEQARVMSAEASQQLATLEEAEREHIRQALEQSNWMVGGASGAAARLGMKRTTLQSKMAKLGIERPARRGGRRAVPKERLGAHRPAGSSAAPPQSLLDVVPKRAESGLLLTGLWNVGCSGHLICPSHQSDWVRGRSAEATGSSGGGRRRIRNR